MPTYTCRDCNERWDTNTYHTRTCPNCGGVDTALDPGCGCCGGTSALMLIIVLLLILL